MTCGIFHRPAEQRESTSRRQCLRRRVAEPDRLAAKQRRKRRHQNERPDDAAGEGNCKRFAGGARGLPEGDHQDIVTGQEEAAEVRQAALLHEADERRVLRVEDGKEVAGEEYDQQITAHADGEEHVGGKAAREAGWACPDCWRHFEKERIQQRPVLPKA